MDRNLLYKELSYKIQGAAMEVRHNYGPGQKESIYQNAYAEELTERKISFEKEKQIKIHSPKTTKVVGTYIPDFLIEDKILIEVKALELISKSAIDQLYYYLRNSSYELGYLINFGGEQLFMKRIVYSNENKPWFKRTRNDA